jgi:cation diffusion facilitator family transporter
MPDRNHQKTMRAINLGLVSNVFLAALKTVIGIIGHSPALLADGINSTSDVAYYVVVSIFVRLARKPADEQHPYGHRQLESIAALIVGSFVITTAVAIFWNSISSVFDLLSGQGEFAGAQSVALWVALFTVAVKILLTYITSRLGAETGNSAVAALAYDHRNDVFSALAASVGILLGRMGYPWVDPLAGALVALVILRTGIEILRESSAELMDDVPGKSLCQQITEITRSVAGVRQIDEIRAHRFGPYLTVNLTIGIDGNLTVAAGDRIASDVEKTLMAQLDLVRTVHVHFHPARAESDR